MKNALYADVLFFINFGMDLISIWLTFLIVHQRSSGIRLFLSSALGGAYGVVSVLIGAEGIVSFIFGFIVSFFMILISSKTFPGFMKLLKYTVILWGVGALCGGIITALCSLGNGDVYGFRTHNAPFFIFALGILAAGAIVKAISSYRAVKSCVIYISVFNERYRASVLVDSGNLVREPMSGLPVIILSSAVFSKTLSNDLMILSRGYADTAHLSDEEKIRVRIIRVSGISSEKLLTAFMPDDIKILSNSRKNVKSVRAYVAIDPELCVKDHDGLIPSSIIN